MKKRDLVLIFREFVKKEKLFTPDDRLLVAVSGGLDSTTLTHLLHREGYSIGITHCNFQLRGDDSEKDEQHVRQLASDLAVTYHLATIDLADISLPGESTQIAARRTRYIHFKKILDEYNYDWLVTAHHQQDSLESMFINLLRGTGFTGLMGIKPRRDRIARPLLEATREDLLTYARKYKIEWREDASNSTDDYLRNRIRHDLLPVLHQLGLHDGVMARTLSRLRAEANISEAGYESWRIKVVSESPGQVVIDRVPLSQQSEGLVLLLFRRFSPYADFTDDQYRQMITLTGLRTIESASGIAEVSPSKIVFRAKFLHPTKANILIEHLPFSYQHGSLTYSLEEVKRPEKLQCTGTSYLRSTELPLHLRSRQNGDRFLPLGMAGRSKKVKALLNDLKLSVREKEEVLLLTTKDNNVMAVGPFRISEGFSVTPEDQIVLRFEVKWKSPDLH